MNSRERFLRTFDYESVDYRPFNLPGPWPDTLARWHREGLGQGEDYHAGVFLQPTQVWNVNYTFGIWPPFETRVVETTDEVTISIDGYGRTVRNFNNHTSMPEWLDFPVKGGDDLKRVMAEHVDVANLDARYPADWEQKLRDSMAAGKVIMINGGGYYWTLRSLAGVAEASYLFYDAPEAVEELFDRLEAQILDAMRRTFAICTPDVVGFGEDIAGKNGPLISPATFRQMILPRYKRAMELAHGAGVKHVWYDSDGDLRLFIPDYLDVGINGLAPCEVAAGMQPNELRNQYGRELRLVGGVDKREIAKGPAAIDAELARLKPLIDEGGFVPAIDHSVSSDISWENYRYYLERLQETVMQ